MLYSTASFASSRRTPDTRTGSSLRSYSGPGGRTDVPSQAARVTAFLIFFLTATRLGLQGIAANIPYRRDSRLVGFEVMSLLKTKSCHVGTDEARWF